jgi:hypothetical protein
MAIVDAAIAVGTAVGADALGTAGAAMVGGSLIGAGVGGTYSALTGDGNVLNSMLNGALIGGGTMGLGAAAGLTGASGTLFGPAQTGLLSSAAYSALPSAAGVVAPGAGAAPVATGTVVPAAESFAPAAGYVPSGGTASLQAMADTQAAEDMAAGASAGPVPAGTGAGLNTYVPGATNPSFWDSSMGTAAKWGAGLLAANAILGNDGKKYGTYTQQQVTTNPLPYTSNYGTYKPLDTSVMRPMGTPPAYTGNPYGTPGYIGSRVGYAAGGSIDGGLSDANPIQNPSVGPVEQMSRDNALGQNQMFPQASINSPSFSNATNTPYSQNMVAAAGDVNVDPYTGAEKFAAGGAVPSYSGGGWLEDAALMPIRQLQAASNNPEQALVGANTPFETSMWNGLLGTNYTPTTNMWGAPTDAAVAGNVSAGRPTYAAQGGIMQGYAQGGVPSLGGYAAGGNPRLLKGPGDGMSDNIPAVIGHKQPARLADGEFVVPADVVSHLGNGSTDAGAKKLHTMMDNVRKARTGRKAQGKQIKADKFIPK